MKPTTYKTLSTALAVVFMCGLLPSCATQRTIKNVRVGKTTFGEDDSDKIRKKFTDHGYTIDESGNINADENDLYSDSSSKFGNKTFSGKKEARLGKSDFGTKDFKTPEYLKRTDFRGAGQEAKEGTLFAREGNSQASETGRTFKTKDASFGQKINPFASKKYRESNNSYKTYNNRFADRAISNAPTADGPQRAAGFADETKMSMDDVKKMLNPTAYADAKGL